MPKNFAVHTTLLLFSVAGVFFWLNTPFLFPLTLQLVAVLVLAYAAVHWMGKKKRTRGTRSTIPFDLTLLTSMILLLVTETGALTSPFFFLLYFLLFAVALLYEIEATLILTGTLLLFFLLLPSTDFSNLSSLSELSALLMITPLAIFAGHQKEVIAEETALAARLKGELSAEENDTLIFLSLNLKKTLLASLDSLSLVIPKTPVKEMRDHLTTLYQDLKGLYRSASDLEEIVGHGDNHT
jgi:hypothetical protein